VNVTLENEPELLVVTVLGEVVCVVPANSIVTVEEAAKPEPDMVTVEPAAPDVGFKAIDGVTVYVAVGELVPSVKVKV
jgi:hypothetical protein